MKQEHKHLTLKSSTESIIQLDRLIEEVCDTHNLNHNYLGCISVSLHEAFQNAMIHGNQNDPKKTVTIDFEKSATGISFTVKDEGTGFDFGKIPDIKDDGKEQTFPGRGLFLIKSLSDNVSFNESGNEIQIGFKISSINIETAIDRMEKFKEYSKPEQKVTN